MPASSWSKPEFDDSAWQAGPGGFGTKETPGAVVRTEWNTAEIWLRRTFDLKSLEFKNLQLRIHHNEDADIFINGQRVSRIEGYQSEYLNHPIQLSHHNKPILKTGTNTLAIHCHQSTGGQYIDVGLVDVLEK